MKQNKVLADIDRFPPSLSTHKRTERNKQNKTTLEREFSPVIKPSALLWPAALKGKKIKFEIGRGNCLESIKVYVAAFEIFCRLHSRQKDDKQSVGST